MLEFTNRDWALVHLGEIDLEMQLVAVRSVLRRNRAEDAAANEEIQALGNQIREAQGEDAYLLELAWVDRLNDSVYLDAANSMSAVGMLAPLTESLFTTLFAAISKELAGTGRATGGSRAGLEDYDYWNPHVYVGSKGRRDDLALGIMQLANDCGLGTHLPADSASILKALFSYRNAMFHNGFEWPMPKRRAFEQQMSDERWPDGWFTAARSGGDPWIFYMSDAFTGRCLGLIDEVLEGAGVIIRSVRNSTS